MWRHDAWESMKEGSRLKIPPKGTGFTSKNKTAPAHKIHHAIAIIAITSQLMLPSPLQQERPAPGFLEPESCIVLHLNARHRRAGAWDISGSARLSRCSRSINNAYLQPCLCLQEVCHDVQPPLDVGHGLGTGFCKQLSHVPFTLPLRPILKPENVYARPHSLLL